MAATARLLSSRAPQLSFGCASRSSLRRVGLQKGSVLQTATLPALASYYSSKSFPSHTIISMPALSPTMTAGNIGTWHKKAGDTLAPGDVLVELETDKAQMDFEFQEEGVLAKILKDSGEKDVAVGNPIAVMVEEGDDISAFESFTIDDAGGDKKPAKESKDESKSEKSATPKESPKDDSSKDSSALMTQESDSKGARLETALQREPKISPAVRKLALDKGVPLSQVKGSGPKGQITKADVEKFKGAGGAAAPAGAAAPSGGGPAYEDVPASSMRKTIASRLTQSMNENPHYFVASRVSVTKLLKLRQALNSAGAGAYKLSVNDILIKAIALAARRVPVANSSWREDADGQVVIRTNHVVDVSVAVATPVGLITPVVKGADSLGLRQISERVRDLGKRARDNKLKPEEYQGGTITVSNMGMNDAVERFTAVINPPQACIVAVGTVRKVAVPSEVEVEEGQEPAVEWDDQMVLTGSFDHKVVDGAVGGEFMRELKRVVENPVELML